MGCVIDLCGGCGWVGGVIDLRGGSCGGVGCCVRDE